MSRVPEPPEEWVRECVYIRSVTDRVVTNSPDALRSFNDDRACFVRYCQMQQRYAMEDKCFDSAEYIGHCLDDLEVL